jgi:hypothetical protein
VEIARRDLNRYYNKAIKQYTLPLSFGEAMLIVDAPNGYIMTPEGPHLIFFTIQESITNLGKKWDVDRKKLLQKFVDLTLQQ